MSLTKPRLPALLKISSEKNTISRLKKDNKHLNLKLSQLQALLEEKEVQSGQSKRSMGATTSSTTSSGVDDENLHLSTSSEEQCAPATAHLSKRVLSEECSATEPAQIIASRVKSSSGHDLFSASTLHASYSGVDDTAPRFYGSHFVGKQHFCLAPLLRFEANVVITECVLTENGRDVLREEEFPEVSAEFQETFLGHTSPITRCRFSASGNNIASASVDGTVRIWTYDSSIPASRNATIYCGAEIMSLDWECKSDRLLLIGTADGGIKAWNVDAKRVVCDLNTTEAFPSVLDLKCSPVEPIFVSAASSRRLGSNSIDSLGYASLTVWNMKTWKAMTVLPLGEDPPAITSLCFNHNGKILAASATDGMIHMFDMSAGLQITGWPAHDTAISSLLFGPDETSIFSLGSDGKIFEWSLQNQGHVLWSRTCSRFSDHETSKYCRHEMALEANGRQLLVTSGSVRAPIYQVRGHSNGLRTLPHSAAITTVDWHPSLPIFLTGSADNSVRVTSIL
ncbi:hypothetical protein QUC31_008227 [Theobroma cacao]